MKRIYYILSSIIAILSFIIISGCASDVIEDYSGKYSNTNGDTTSYIIVNSDSTCDLHNVSGITDYDCSFSVYDNGSRIDVYTDNYGTLTASFDGVTISYDGCSYKR